MSNEKTQHQSTEQLQQAQAISRTGARPPKEVDGYSMVKHLGSGAFGEVWLAIDETTRRRVAIKFYNRRSVADVRALAKEVEKLVTLSADRYVVQLLDVGWDSDPPFYVMDYIERGSLEDLLRAEKKLPVNEALEIFHETAVGLMHLHGKGVLHCDLKPGNVLLDEDRKPRLADFGQSRLSNDATPSLGTLFYMAPEQADLLAVPDAKWDVYALGALFYVMVTGCPPYFEKTLSTNLDSTGDIRHRLEAYREGIQSSPRPNRHREVPGVDRQLAEIIDRCIASEPKKRFDSVQGVLLALQQRQDSISRRPLLFLGLVGPMLLLAVMIVLGWQAYRQAVLDSDRAITEKAIESNRFAAKLAARSASEQIDSYFREIQGLSQNEKFKNHVTTLLADDPFAELRRQLSDPNRNNDDSLKWKRNEFIAAPARLELQNFLQNHHNKLKLKDVASWWVYDLQGNQLVGVFQKLDPGGPETRVNTIGRNYSFRSYFTGLIADLVDESPGASRRFQVHDDPNQRTHIQRPFLSSVFLSEQSETWKIAFSTPIFDGDTIVAIVGLTVQMGDFVHFDEGTNQYAMLFDNRPGKHFGAILEHPLFGEYRAKRKPQPPEFSTVRVDPIQFHNLIFMDPLGKTEAGVNFRDERLAATGKIEFTAENGNREESGLAVVVLENYEAVVRPSHELGKRLSRMALLASVVVLVGALGMWAFVARMFKESRRRLSRAVAGGSDSDSMGNSTGSLLPSQRINRDLSRTITHRKINLTETTKSPEEPARE